MVTDMAMGSSVVRSSGPGFLLSGWEGSEFAGLEVCCFFFGVFWIFFVWALYSGTWRLVLVSRTWDWACAG